MGALSLVFSIVSEIWSSVVASLFPTRVRFSGVALSYNIAVTILAGFAPLAATFLIQHTGHGGGSRLLCQRLRVAELHRQFFCC